MLLFISDCPNRDRGKHALSLNLKDKSKRNFLLQEVIPKVDVLIESYRPQVMENLGLGPDVVHRINPGLIYARLSGFGGLAHPTEYTMQAGHDQGYLALTGILSKFRRNKWSNPVPPNNLLADFLSGSHYLFT